MGSRSQLYYGLRAYLAKSDDSGEVEYSARHLGFHASGDSAELAVREHAAMDDQSPLDTRSRKLLHIVRSTYDAGGSRIVGSKVYDRRGGTLAG